MSKSSEIKWLSLDKVSQKTGLSRKVLSKIPDQLPRLEVNMGGRIIRKFRESDVESFISQKMSVG